MKITLRELRLLIGEAAKTVAETAESGIAACVTADENDLAQVVLYRTSELEGVLNVISGAVKTEEFELLLAPYVDVAIIGAIRGEVLDEFDEDVTFITRVAARKGYGPLLYDFMSAKRGWITPDPYTTSHEAMRIWDFYKRGRPDVIIKPTSPIHGTKIDLDFKVRVPSSTRTEVNKLEAVHEKLMQKLTLALRDDVLTSVPGIRRIIEKKIDTTSSKKLEDSV